MWKAAVLAALVAAGCQELHVDQSKVVPAPEGADTAEALVLAFYGVTDKPEVYWYGGAALTCGKEGTGFVAPSGDCVWGAQSEDGTLIILSDMQGAPISQTSLAHELGHFASDRRGEGGDAGHCGHYYRDPGETCAEGFYQEHGDVGLANTMLAALGM